jgi:hypothetical protein
MKEQRAIVILIVFVLLVLFNVSLGFINNDGGRKASGGGEAVDSRTGLTGEAKTENKPEPAPAPADAVTTATPNGGTAPAGGATDTVTGATTNPASSSSGSYSPAPDTTTGPTPAPGPSPTPGPAPPPDTTTGPTPPAPSPGPTPAPEPEEDEREDDSASTIGWFPAGGAIGGLTALAIVPAGAVESFLGSYPLLATLVRILYQLRPTGQDTLAKLE